MENHWNMNLTQNKNMTDTDLIEIGFKKVTTPTVGNVLVFDLGKNYQIATFNVTNTSGSVFFEAVYPENPNKPLMLSCPHNFSFDGVLTVEKIKYYIERFTDYVRNIKN